MLILGFYCHTSICVVIYQVFRPASSNPFYFAIKLLQNVLKIYIKLLSVYPSIVTSLSILGTRNTLYMISLHIIYVYVSLPMSFSHTHSHLCSPVCKMEPRGLIARRVTEVAQSTLDMVSTAVDYPLCECTSIFSLAQTVGCVSPT